METLNLQTQTLKKLTKREMITRAEKSEYDIRNKKVITQSQLEKIPW